MPNHTIFNERPENQDRAITVLEKLGYQYIPRSQAEALRGRLSNVLFPEILREFLHRQSFVYRGKLTPFSGRSIGKAISDIDAPLVSGLMSASKAIYDLLLSGNSYEEELFDGGRQSFDLKYIDWEHPENNIQGVMGTGPLTVCSVLCLCFHRLNFILTRNATHVTVRLQSFMFRHTLYEVV